MGYKTFLTLTLGAVALFVANGAAAQNSRSRIPQNGAGPARIAENGMSVADRGRMAMVDYSNCVLRRNRSGVMAALAIFPGEQSNVALRRLVVDECLSAEEIQFSFILFRGALYTALYRERFSRQMPVLPPRPANFRAGAPEPLDQRAAQEIALREFGECVVRADPATAHGIVTGRVGSAEETWLFGVLGPLLGPCLYEGQQVTFSKNVLTGLLAEILFRDATEAAAIAPAGNN